jgi:hypothetical protein
MKPQEVRKVGEWIRRQRQVWERVAAEWAKSESWAAEQHAMYLYPVRALRDLKRHRAVFEAAPSVDLADRIRQLELWLDLLQDPELESFA